MKRTPLTGTGKVCGFTLKQICLAKGWLISTILFAALLLLGIPLVLFLISSVTSDKDEKETDAESIRTVYVVDETAGAADYTVFKELGYKDVQYTAAESLEQAAETAKSDRNSLILRVTDPDSMFLLTVCLPDETEVTRDDAGKFAAFAEKNFSGILMQKANITAEGAAMLGRPVLKNTAELYADGSGESGTDTATEVFSMMLPFTMMMIMYMMVLLYAQSIGNSVILEKQSKLMETMLTAVEPFALMTGKLLAVALAAALQLLIWLIAGVLGVMGGAAFALSMAGNALASAAESPEAAQQASEVLGISVSGGNVVLALVFILVGFLLFLALGAISGALASKSEDLAKTNIVFTLILVISMLLCLNFHAEGPEPSLMSDAAWLSYFPFTSILVVPGKLILGQITAGAAAVSLLILVATVVLFTALAAFIYRMLILYRGAPPSPATLINMMKENLQKRGSE